MDNSKDKLEIINEVSVFHNYIPIGPSSFLHNPDERIICYEDYSNLGDIAFMPFGNQLRIVCVLPGDNELNNCLQLVSVLNLIDAEIDILCTKDTSDFCSLFANSNINFKDINGENILIKANFIITHALSAVHFIKTKIPVIILGPNGLGGFVSPDNLKFLYLAGFMGRPGGNTWEYVPVNILLEEILTIRNHICLKEVLEENAQLVALLPFVSKSAMPDVLDLLRNKYLPILDDSVKWRQKPYVRFNVKVIHGTGNVYFKRQYFNDTLAAISEEDYEFVKEINGENDCEYLFGISKMELADFWELIYLLISSKIITI